MIAAMMLVMLFACNGNGNGDGSDGSSSADDAPELVTLCADGASEYKIVRPDSDYGKVLKEAVGALRTAVKKAAGVELDVAEDWVKDTADIPGAAKEILVGATNRPESISALKELKTDDFCVRFFAESGRVVIVGGSDEGYARILPLLQIMGQKILHCGRAGMGQQAKLANQAAIAGVMFSVCESLIYAQQAGLDVRKWHELVSVGAAGSVAMKTLGSRIMDGDFRPGFFIDHFVKDLGLILEECRRMHLVLPGTALAEQFYRSMQAKGHGKEGTQALVRALAEFSGKVWTPLIGG